MEFETWGYQYIRGASDQFICRIEGANALNIYPEYRQRHARADELISLILGSEPCVFYIRRERLGRNPEYEIWEFIVATDRDDFSLPIGLEERQKTLQIWASVPRDGRGYLGLIKINLVNLEQGHDNAFSSLRLILLQRDRLNNIGIPETAFAEIVAMPISTSYVPTKDHIQGWSNYLKIQKSIAEKSQFYVPTVSFRYSPSKNSIDFTIKPDLATSNGFVSITPEGFWKRAKKAINKPLKYLAHAEEIHYRYADQELGNIHQVRPDINQIEVKLEPDIAESFTEEDFTLPEILFFKDNGSLAQIRWQEDALRNLRDGHTHNFNLSTFFFEASQAKPLVETVQIAKQDLFLDKANDSQLAAVEAVLAAEDLILLQGPPGTGKTTVITEICYQIAIRGGRTLIASQANLAVDNALSRLPHHPALRPVRDGNSGSVSREGESFLSANVVKKWLNDTSAECENRLSKHQKVVKGLRPLLTSLDRFQDYLQFEDNFPQQRQELLNTKRIRDLECQEKREIYNKLREEQEKNQLMQSELQQLIASNQVFCTQQQIKIAELNIRKNELILAINELEEWQKTANSQIYIILKRCLQQRDSFTEALIPLPSQLQIIAQEVCQQPWKQYFDECQVEINNFIFQLNEYDEVYKIGNQIYWLFLQKQQTSVNLETSNSQVSQFKEFLAGKLQGNRPLAAINKLHHYCQIAIREINQLTETRSLEITTIKLEAIKQQYEELIKNLQSVNWEFKLYQLTAIISKSITVSAKNLLNQLLRDTEEKLLQISEYQNNLQAELENLKILETINNYIECQVENMITITNRALNELTETENIVQEVQNQIEELESNLEKYRNWWVSIYKEIPDWLKPDIHDQDLFNTEILRTKILIKFDLWEQELEKSEAYLNQWERTIQKWIDKLRQPSDIEYEALRKTYLDNANVIGVTCMKAAKCNYLQKSSHFDVVIVDEVSKSTPPELLIPTLKGKKVVMIGDYRQLPAILDEENLDELAEELSIPKDNLQFLEQSWFGLQFQAARTSQPSIAKRLNVQYRMHPQIMEAINQFYDEGDGGLTCGLTRPDIERAHNLAGSVIKENNHIMWVPIPLDRKFGEKQDGTSYYNEVEISKIQILCEQMEQSWANKVAHGAPKKEIGIITFYGSQLKRIETTFPRNRFPSLDIHTGTVDRFQGMEKPVIIVSMVRNNPHSKFGFAQTPERVNVAFSRAKELLIIVGCHDLFTQLPIYQKVSQVVHKYGGFIDLFK
ncbi:DEAD/DEAH box helicase [Anabaenopsis elenkinii]|uniref:AAA family ATPase n=1 Tax=Anabaenopsis elenkinii CCIBt3563 TaxID=2779889 RepID=A0A7S6RDE7_9CYAN|nr:AAA domain-containing protein [Anabaenopsis elenkinii]QOV21432.1 AAA family ATPase [Anabaenopsis elenkinii CCIBt3563]